jgi:hypothetical protein
LQLVVLAELATLGLAPNAHASEPEPSEPRNGLAGLVVGSLGLAAGVFTVGIGPAICSGGTDDGGFNKGCLAAFLSVGTVGVATGALGLSLGIPRRRAYKRWQRERDKRLQLGVVPSVRPGGAELSLSGRF